MAGLIGLMITFNSSWQQMGILSLAPATALIGFGQSFIVSCFFRIGLAEVPKDHAGSGSAMLSTVQQAALGLGPMVLGTVFSQVLQPHGNYQHAVLAALGAEWLIMLALVVRALMSGAGWRFRRGNLPALKGQARLTHHLYNSFRISWRRCTVTDGWLSMQNTVTNSITSVAINSRRTFSIG
ncbi:MFS transporter [Klebsiella pneumoniae]|nr:MFS transporter [Klebsiella pneumoniae]